MPQTAKLPPFSPPCSPLEEVLPEWTRGLGDLQTGIPGLAKDSKKLAELDCAVGEIETLHRNVRGDARELAGLSHNSVHLALTSPPYWTLKKYRDADGQMGHFEDYDHFLEELDKVWLSWFTGNWNLSWLAFVSGGGHPAGLVAASLPRRFSAFWPIPKGVRKRPLWIATVRGLRRQGVVKERRRPSAWQAVTNRH